MNSSAMPTMQHPPASIDDTDWSIFVGSLPERDQADARVLVYMLLKMQEHQASIHHAVGLVDCVRTGASEWRALFEMKVERTQHSRQVDDAAYKAMIYDWMLIAGRTCALKVCSIRSLMTKARNMREAIPTLRESVELAPLQEAMAHFDIDFPCWKTFREAAARSFGDFGPNARDLAQPGVALAFRPFGTSSLTKQSLAFHEEIGSDGLYELQRGTKVGKLRIDADMSARVQSSVSTFVTAFLCAASLGRGVHSSRVPEL